MIITKKRSPYCAKLSGSILKFQLTSVLAIGLMLSACDTGTTNINTAKVQKTLHRVEVIEVEKKPVFLTQTVSGTLEAVTKIRLYNEESGRIVKTTLLRR